MLSILKSFKLWKNVVLTLAIIGGISVAYNKVYDSGYTQATLELTKAHKDALELSKRVLEAKWQQKVNASQELLSEKIKIKEVVKTVYKDVYKTSFKCKQVDQATIDLLNRPLSSLKVVE